MTAPILIGTVGQDLTEEDWLAKRRVGIGGSDAPAIAGASDWASPMSVYLKKLGLAEENMDGNEPAEWGLRLEGVVIEKYEEMRGQPVYGRQRFCTHPDYDWMICTIDGLTADGDVPSGERLYEGKTSGAWKAKTWRDDVPLSVWVQVQHNMAVTGLESADVAALIGGNHYEQHHIPRDDAYIAQLIELERDFYENHLAPQIPPPIDGSRATEKALSRLFPDDDGSEITIDDEKAEALARDYIIYQRVEAKAKKDKAACANELKSLLATAERATIGGYKVQWSTIERDAYTVKASSYRKLSVVERGAK